MGREATGLCQWRDQTGQVKALLESTEIILRGNIRARLPRGGMLDIDAQSGTLSLRVDGGTLTLDLGDGEASKWAEILRKPPPPLAQKLGLAGGAKAFVIGTIVDETLAVSLDGLTVLAIAEAACLIAEIHTRADLDAACAVAQSAHGASVWLIHEKGRAAVIKDSDIRGCLRAQSYVDTKSTAVSAAMTGTLFRFRG